MKDIFVRTHQPRSRWPWMVLVVLILLALAGGAWFLLKATLSDTTELTEEIEALENVVEPNSKVANKPKPAPAKPDPGANLLNQARRMFRTQQLNKARNLCYQVLDESRRPAARTSAEAMLNTVNTELAFSPHAMKEKVDYTIRSGDTLGKLAKKYKTTIEMIQKSNNLKGPIIREGDWLRILMGSFSIQINRTENELVVMLDDRFFKRYRVGTGTYGKTPLGRYTITEKIAAPPWWRPDGKMIPFGDDENILGTHWMTLTGVDNPSLRGYGIHGTWDPDSIGKQSSAGCVRLNNEEVEELFTLVPRGTLVKIIE